MAIALFFPFQEQALPFQRPDFRHILTEFEGSPVPSPLIAHSEITDMN